MGVRSAREQFLDALSHYYKTERDRAERCMSDIITILGNETQEEHLQVEAILERLTAHYQRSEMALSSHKRESP